MKLGPFPNGMNNRQPDYALPGGTLRNAVNCDIDQLGFVTRRAGSSEQVYSGTGIQFGFGCAGGEFIVENTSLKRFNADDTATTIYDGIYGATFTYEYFNGIVYFSDGLISLKIYADNTVTFWGISVPDAPVLSAVSGTLAEGTYLASVSFYDNNGVESGASEIQLIKCSGGVKFTSLPTTSDPQVAGIRLFLSTADGDLLYKVAELPLGTTSYSVTLTGYTSKRFCETLLLTLPPSGQIIRFFKAAMFIASGPNIWRTDPYSLDHLSKGKAYNQFAEDITVVEPVNDGMYIVSDKTYFYGGTSSEDFVEVKGFEYGALLGSGKKIPNSNNVAWQSTRGMVIGGPGGEVINRVEKNIAAHSGDSAQTLIREHDGKQQFIANIKNPTVSTAAAKGFMEAEIIRKGSQ